MAQLAFVEQERRDFELALRLAQVIKIENYVHACCLQNEAQSQGVISEQFKLRQKQHAYEKTELSRSTNIKIRKIEHAIGNQLDLSEWKYAKLRDMINTSCGEYMKSCDNHMITKPHL